MGKTRGSAGLSILWQVTNSTISGYKVLIFGIFKPFHFRLIWY